MLFWEGLDGHIEITLVLITLLKQTEKKPVRYPIIGAFGDLKGFILERASVSAPK